jgi:putative oxidoreductase
MNPSIKNQCAKAQCFFAAALIYEDAREDATMTGVNYMAALGRIMMAAIFLVSGFLHVLNLASPADVRAPIAVVTSPDWAFYIATAIELIGGTFLALGFGTRYIALVLAIFMLAMSIGSDFGQFDHFMKNLAIAGGLIQVWAFGSGGLAITHSRPRAV